MTEESVFSSLLKLGKNSSGEYILYDLENAQINSCLTLTADWTLEQTTVQLLVMILSQV